MVICILALNATAGLCFADEEVQISGIQDKKELSLSDFAFMKKEMKVKDIIAKVGDPHFYMGFGIRSGVYNLKNGDTLRIVAGPEGKLQEWKDNAVVWFVWLYLKEGICVELRFDAHGNIMMNNDYLSEEHMWEEGHSLGDFEFLQFNMDKQKIIDAVGEPECDNDMDFWRGVYKLKNGNKIYLNYMGTGVLKSIMIETKDRARCHVDFYAEGNIAMSNDADLRYFRKLTEENE